MYAYFYVYVSFPWFPFRIPIGIPRGIPASAKTGRDSDSMGPLLILPQASRDRSWAPMARLNGGTPWLFMSWYGMFHGKTHSNYGEVSVETLNDQPLKPSINHPFLSGSHHFRTNPCVNLCLVMGTIWLNTRRKKETENIMEWIKNQWRVWSSGSRSEVQAPMYSNVQWDAAKSKTLRENVGARASPERRLEHVRYRYISHPSHIRFIRSGFSVSLPWSSVLQPITGSKRNTWQ